MIASRILFSMAIAFDTLLDCLIYLGQATNKRCIQIQNAYTVLESKANWSRLMLPHPRWKLQLLVNRKFELNNFLNLLRNCVHFWRKRAREGEEKGRGRNSLPASISSAYVFTACIGSNQSCSPVYMPRNHCAEDHWTFSYQNKNCAFNMCRCEATFSVK